MKITEEDLRQRYSGLDTEELVDLAKQNTLTSLAISVISDELESRGVNIEKLFNVEKTNQVTHKSKRNNIFKTAPSAHIRDRTESKSNKFSWQSGLVDPWETILHEQDERNAEEKTRQAFKYVANGKIKKLNVLLDSGLDVNSRDKSSGDTLFIRAAEAENIDIAKLLLKYDVDIKAMNGKGRTALHNAVEIGSLEMVAFLLECGLDVNSADELGYTPAWLAVKKNNDELLRLLISNGANIHVLARVFEDGTKASLLYLAAQLGNISIIEALIDNGADANIAAEDGSTPFIVALFEGEWAAAEYLLKSSDGQVLTHTTKEYRSSALLRASMYGQVSLVKGLLDKGANVNDSNAEGTTSLHAATELSGSEEVVQLLVNKGADVNAQDINGVTPLHRAAENGLFNIAKILLINGANPGAISKKGDTPEDIARGEGYHQLVSLLELPAGTDYSKIESVESKEKTISDPLKAGDASTGGSLSEEVFERGVVIFIRALVIWGVMTVLAGVSIRNIMQGFPTVFIIALAISIYWHYMSNNKNE